MRGTAFPYHAHSLVAKMCLVLEGAGTSRHDGAEYPLRAGDVVLYPDSNRIGAISGAFENTIGHFTPRCAATDDYAGEQ
jgi:uncharacterized cupin superfamily protein